MADIPWGLVIFLVGLAYGALKTGRQDKSDLFKSGLMIGIVVALVIVLLGFLLNVPPLGLVGALGIIVSAIVLSLLFVLGVWLGDLMTGARKRYA